VLSSAEDLVPALQESAGGWAADMATSHAQDDSGVFSVNFRDERYLPFETAGVMPAPSSPVAVPQLWWLSIAQSDLGTILDSVEDFYLLVQYKVS
jgi:Tc toxin complex TcA C-terminal TcB-binding domain